MPRYSPCDCVEAGCFECAVGFVISELGFSRYCECFDKQGEPCGNRCGGMRHEWVSALKRGEAPYEEWAQRRLAKRGEVLANATIETDTGDVDITELVRSGQPVPSGFRSLFMTFEQDRGVAALELASEVQDDPISFDAARLLVAGFIESGEAVPEPLRCWATGVFTGAIERPRSKGKIKGSMVARDKLIFRLIRDLVQYCGLKPTASDRSEGKSACHAVARGFSLIGINPRSYESVVKIWEDRHNLSVFDSRDD